MFAPKVGKLILVGDLETPLFRKGSVVICTRVSSSDDKPYSNRRVAPASTRATWHGYVIDRMVTEARSAPIGDSHKFLSPASDPEVENILIKIAPVALEPITLRLCQAHKLRSWQLTIDPVEVSQHPENDITNTGFFMCLSIWSQLYDQ